MPTRSCFLSAPTRDTPKAITQTHVKEKRTQNQSRLSLSFFNKKRQLTLIAENAVPGIAAYVRAN